MQIILHQRVYISTESLYMPGKSQIIHMARNSPDQLLFFRVISVPIQNDTSWCSTQRRTNSFEVKLPWVKILALPLPDRVNCEHNCPHSLSKENWNIKEGKMDHLKFLPETGWPTFWKGFSHLEKYQHGSTLNLTRKTSFLPYNLLAALSVGSIFTLKYSLKMLTWQIMTILERRPVWLVKSLKYYWQISVGGFQIFPRKSIFGVF